jgi:hypothetical protein
MAEIYYLEPFQPHTIYRHSPQNPLCCSLDKSGGKLI